MNTKAASAKTPTFLVCVPTEQGNFLAGYSDQGLCLLHFPSRKQNSAGITADASLPPKVRRWHKLTTAAVKAITAGRKPGAVPPLDLSSGTSFQQSVWKALLEIQCGSTMSYGEIARALGRKGAARAVGAACGANPVPVLVPCHRVLAANKRIGGFSGGLDWKRKLLACEKVALA